MISSLIVFLQSFPPEGVLALIFLASSLFLILFARFFGEMGLCAYSILAIVLGNIQVLKGALLSFWSAPVALGTILFSSTFIVSDVLTDCFGKKAAQRCVGLGFLSALMVTVVMTLTVGVAPLPPSVGGDTASFVLGHRAMHVLFTPSVALLTASLIAYIMSQLWDIYLFQKLKERWPHQSLWGRSMLSTALATLLDNVCFSTLAWVVFAETPVSFETLVWTYILGTYVLRLLMTVCSLPVLSLARRALGRVQQKEEHPWALS